MRYGNFLSQPAKQGDLFFKKNTIKLLGNLYLTFKNVSKAHEKKILYVLQTVVLQLVRLSVNLPKLLYSALPMDPRGTPLPSFFLSRYPQ